MKWEVKDEGKCTKVITVTVDSETVRKSHDKVFNDIKNNARVDGYRKGKAPEAILRSMYAGTMREEVLKDVVPASYSEALKESNLNVVTYPNVRNVKFTGEGVTDVTYEIVAEVAPVFEVADYSKMKIDAKKLKAVTNEDVEREIKRIRQYRGTLKVAEKDTVADGDYAEVSLSAFIDGSAVSELTTETQLVNIGGGPGALLDLEKGIKSMKVGQEKDIEVNFPKDYFNNKFAGKKALFKTKLKAVKTLDMPEMNDAFAKEATGHDTVEALKTAIETELKKQAEQEARGHNTSLIFKELLEKNRFDVPKGLVEQELDNMINRYMNSLRQQGMRPEQLGINTQELRQRSVPQAEDNIRLMYILHKIGEKEGISISDADVEAEIRRIAADMKQDPDAMVKQAKAKDSWDALKGKLHEDRVVEKLLSIAVK